MHAFLEWRSLGGENRHGGCSTRKKILVDLHGTLIIQIDLETFDGTI